MLTFRTAAEPDFEHVNRLARQVHELHVSLHPDLYRSVKHPISCEEFREMVERDQLVVACRGEHIVAYAAFAVRDFDGASILQHVPAEKERVLRCFSDELSEERDRLLHLLGDADECACLAASQPFFPPPATHEGYFMSEEEFHF